MKKKILVIDDKPGLLEELEDILVMEGYEVFIACNLLQGIKQLHNKSPDLIITDFMLSYRSGNDPVEDINALKADKNIPIILLSGNTDKESINKAKQVSVDHFLKKPSSSNQLVKTVYTTIYKDHEQPQINSCR
ncbi:response regulator [Fulvivirga sp. M361]|uniref:response regulator n=1 Tax=Fulvivirga sp. M361 TaxID=2594266 RepID=UPI00117B7A47|nr:response regulator [Fulvivirga sp. M361]TRX51865.1 response regulator [Fulvivirga sp. M361]